MDYSKIITTEPGKMGGKPCIRGMRITVDDVLDDLVSGMTEAEILADFPDLTRNDLRAALAFAADRERRPGEARLQELLVEGLNSGEDIALDDQFWKDLRTEAVQLLEQRKQQKP